MKVERHNRPAWILCNPRCGSSFLCEMLNNTGKFETSMKDRSFGEWLKYYSSAEDLKKNPPLFNKCTRKQFFSMFGEISRSAFEAFLPGIRYIVIHRRDLYAQTVSMYIAKSTDQYHVFDEESLADYLNHKIEFNEEVILRMYKNACGYPAAWNQFLKGADYLELYYEDLMSQPVQELEKVCRHLGVFVTLDELIASASKHRLIPTTRPEAADFVARLKRLTEGSADFRPARG